jgi:hypothetical protein
MQYRKKKKNRYRIDSVKKGRRSGRGGATLGAHAREDSGPRLATSHTPP